MFFGPATIKHNGSYIGKTFGGGFLEIKYVETSNLKDGTKIKIPYEITGEIKLFNIKNKEVFIEDTYLYDYGELEIVTSNNTIMLYKAKIYFPDKISFGTNNQQSFNVFISAIPNEQEKLIKTWEA